MIRKKKQLVAPYKVSVTDYNFQSLDIEKAILEPMGCEVASLKTGKDRQELCALVTEADCVITQFAPVDAAVIEAVPKCKVIVRYGIGVDNVDLRAAAAKGIPVCNVPDYCIDEVADHALAMILDLTRKITANAAKVKAGG
jgi:D-3-phosphoglycerate dehydrogenase